MDPLALVYVHVVAPQFAWVAVRVNAEAPPLESTATCVLLLYPGRFVTVQAVQAVYVFAFTKAASSAVAAFRKSDLTLASKPLFRYAANCGIAMAARIPMIAMTTNSSMSVKPPSPFNLNLSIVLFTSLIFNSFN
jgi:hypothetical protein